ncbi:MAG: hypothetical protein KF901_07470 [Myxococcales bacterium]|nr:hypothetical protein [Myxococcales bacterium]
MRRALLLVPPTLLALLFGCGSRTGLEIASAPWDADVPDLGPAPECRRDADCDDGIPCTRDACEGGACVVVTLDEACDDGRFCNGAERCVAGLGCAPGTPPPCSDGVSCTRDACDAALDECVSTPDDALCTLSQRCDATVGCLTRAIASWGGRIIDVDLPSGTSRVRFTTPGRDLTDVALHPDGTLYGLTVEDIVELDPVTRGRRVVASLASLGVRLDGLDVSPDGALYASGGDGVFRVDRATGTARREATLPSGWVSAGDLSFFEGRAFIAIARNATRSAPSSLAELDLIRGTARVLGPTGYACVWGLAEVEGALYGLTCQGNVLRLDLESGAGTLLAQPPGYQFWGASSR